LTIDAEGPEDAERAAVAEYTERQALGDAGTLSVGDAVAAFLKRQEKLDRASTVAVLTEKLRVFQAWTAGRSIVRMANLTRGVVAEFNDHVADMRKRVPLAGGGKGARAESKEPLSVRSRNAYRMVVGQFLNDARKRGLTPLLSKDHIYDALEKERVSHERGPILADPKALRALLHAAIAYDEGRPEPVAGPFTMTVLLTGMRRDEAAELSWSEVHADEVRLGTRTKTREGRQIRFDIAPSLKRLFATPAFVRARLRGGPDGRVFAEVSPRVLMERLVERRHGAPEFDWQMLRRTHGSFLWCAPGMRIAPGDVALRLGHDADVCQRYYAHSVGGIPANARTVEAAMRVTKECARIVEMVRCARHQESGAATKRATSSG
jgi:integrase